MTASASAGRRNILTNAAASWLAFAAQIAVAFFLSPVLVHRLGDQRYGIWSLVESILLYLMLFDFGVAASVVRYVARFEAQRDLERLNRIFSTSLCIFGVTGLLTMVAGAGLALVGLPLFKVPGELLTEARWMLVFLAVNLGLGLPLGVFPCLLDGLGRYPARTAIRLAVIAVRSTAFLLIVEHGGGLVALGAAITACSLAEYLVSAAVAWSYLPGVRFSLRFVDRETFQMIRGYSVDAFVIMLAARVSFQTDALVIGPFRGPAAITFFVIAGRLVEYSKDCLRAVTAVLTPAVSVLEARGDQAGIRRMLLDSTRYTLWLIVPIQVGLVVFGRPFLTLWMGPAYAETSYPVLVILAAPLALAVSQSVATRILYGTSRLRWLARVTLVEAAANLVLSLAFVVPWGIAGVAWGTTIPNVCVNVALAVYICRLLQVPLGLYLARAFLRPVVVGIVLAAAWAALVEYVELTTWLRLLATGTLGMAGYAVVAALVEFGPQALTRLAAPLAGRPAGGVPVPVREPDVRPS